MAINTAKVIENITYRFNHKRGDIWGILKYHGMIIQAWQTCVILLTNFKAIRSNRYFTIIGLKDLHLLSVI